MDRERERQIVIEGRKQGKSDDFIKQAVIRDRERRSAAVPAQPAAQPQPAQKSNFLQRVATETSKAGTRSFLSVGGMGQSIQRGVGKVIDTATGGRTKLAETAKGGIFDPASPSGQRAQQITKRAPGAAGLLGTGVAIAGEFAVPGKPIMTAYKAARSTRLFDDIVETVSPRLTPNEAADAITKRGSEKRGLFQSPRPVVGNATTRIAQTIQNHVPGFKPKGDLLDNINVSRAAVTKEAQLLKADIERVAGDTIYPFKELAARLRSIEKPALLVSDARLNGAFDIAMQRALEVAKAQGGKIPRLFDARKRFDDIIESEFPDLYSNDTLTPMRTAILRVRREMNNFIDDALPKGTGFKERLAIQRDIYEAIEDMAVKATRGDTKEIGKGFLDRFQKRHPVVSGIAKYGGAGVAGSQVFDWLRGR